MKYIHNHPRTAELLKSWKPGRLTIDTWHFFDDRGSYLQKSLQGLLYSIIHRIASFDNRLADVILPMYAAKSPILRDGWPLSDLQEALMLLLDQKELPVDLHIFLDALDEYGDPPEVIADFVTDLSSRRLSEFSRVKICFSSRPWNVFLTRFSDYPGLDIHEHTKGDIRQFARRMINSYDLVGDSPSAERRRDASHLLSDICERAEGVFLWVRLVSAELIKAHSHGASLAQLRELVLEFPQELEEYYTRTVHRVPESRRFDTFVMLEVVVRSSRLLSIEEFIGALECASCENLDQCIMRTSSQLSNPAFTRSAIHYLREYAGGLLEAVSINSSLFVQPMHQTVKDFLNAPGFLHRVLGAEANTVFENGHSFLAKYFIMQAVTRDCVTKTSTLGMFHAQSSESTTGVSQAKFIDSLPDHVIRQSYPNSSAPVFNSRMSFAVVADLRIYVWEKLTKQNVVNDNPSVSLLSCLTETAAMRCYLTIEDSWSALAYSDLSEMCRILLDFGANPFHTWQTLTPFESLFSPLRSFLPGGNHSSNETRAIAGLLLKNGQNPDAMFCSGRPLPGTRMTRRNFVQDIHNYVALFLADAEMSKLLLQHGASVNILDGNGRSPLDIVLGTDFSNITPGEHLKIHDKISVLLDHGGGITRHGENSLKAIQMSQSLKLPLISRLENVLRLTPSSQRHPNPAGQLPLPRSHHPPARGSTYGRSSSVKPSVSAPHLPNRRLEIRPSRKTTTTATASSKQSQGDGTRRLSTPLRTQYVNERTQTP
jgi:ankyrin repeat protein